MAQLLATERYYQSILQITSPKLQKRLEDLVRLIAEVPTVGSVLNRDQLRNEYGAGCLSLDLKPFILVYEYDSETDEAILYGIVHQRSIG